jgi:hypothetical protein
MVQHLLRDSGQKPDSLANIHRRAITEARERGLSCQQMALEFNNKNIRRRGGRSDFCCSPAYIQEMQERLRAKKIGYKREFLREVIKEVRVRGKEITLTYKIPLPSQKLSLEKNEFFTLSQMVVAVGLEPTTSRM